MEQEGRNAREDAWLRLISILDIWYELLPLLTGSSCCVITTFFFWQQFNENNNSDKCFLTSENLYSGVKKETP